MVGIVGSRHLSAAYRPLVAQVVGLLAGQPVATTCGKGACQFVRQAAPRAQVFRSAAFGFGVQALVRRSVACVQAVAALGG